MTELAPPEGRANAREAARAAQVLRMAKERPSMVMRGKLRLSSWVWPRRARIWVSSSGWEEEEEEEEVPAGLRWCPSLFSGVVDCIA